MNIAILGTLKNSKLSIDTQHTLNTLLTLHINMLTIELLFLDNTMDNKRIDVPHQTNMKVYNNIIGEDTKSNYVQLMDHYLENNEADFVVLAVGDLNEELVPLFGERYHMNSFIDCVGLQYTKEGKQLIIQKPEYSGNVIAHYNLIEKSVFSFRSSNTKINPIEVLQSTDIQYVEYKQFIEDKAVKREFIETNSTYLEDADFVIVCGYGVGSKENVKEIIKYADALGAIVCGTKKIIDSGWLPMNLLIGQTGHIISPNLCITIGVSGAAPLLNGISGSKKIIAINNDKDARIFSYADYGIVSDYKDIDFKELSNHEG